MFARALPLLLVVACIVYGGAVDVKAQERQGKYVVFVSVPLPGHINPLVLLANELKSRGWRTAIASTETRRKSVESRGHEFVSSGECQLERNFFDSVARDVVLSPDYMQGSQMVVDWILSLWPCMYDGLLDKLKNDVPDLIVTDFFTMVGSDLADTLNVPYAVHNADLMYAIAPPKLPIADDLPGIMSKQSIHTAGHNLLVRFLSPILRVVLRVAMEFGSQKTLNVARGARGLAPLDFYYSHTGKLILQNTAFGLEYPRALSPLMHMIGPLVNEVDATVPLSLEELKFIEPVDSKPAIFVSMGTLAHLTDWQIEALLNAFRILQDRVNVVWKIRKDDVPADLPPSVLTTQWVSSQERVLNHPNVRAFISHCGINSAHESVYFGTPLLCIPMFGDQLDMAYRVVDAGVGLVADKMNFTAEEISQKLLVLINDQEKFLSNIHKVQDTFKLNGGIQKAANLLEFVAKHGVDHLTPPRQRYSQFADYDIDVLLLNWFTILLVALIIRSCCCCCCCCGSKSRRVVQKTKYA